MKKSAKILAWLLVAAAVFIGCVIAGIELMTRNSQREVAALVQELSPGTPFSMAVQRLGQPKQVIGDADEIIFWSGKLGVNIDKKVSTESRLYIFVHEGPPFRYVVVYTDVDSEKILHTDWCHM